jgi:hypothetical protein
MGKTEKSKYLHFYWIVSKNKRIIRGKKRARGGVVVKALRYKPEGRGFDSIPLRAVLRRGPVLWRRVIEFVFSVVRCLFISNQPDNLLAV